MKRFKATWFCKPDIVEVEVASVTKSMVILADGRREKIEGNYCFYAETREAAKAWLVLCAETDLHLAQRSVNYRKAMLEATKAL